MQGQGKSAESKSAEIKSAEIKSSESKCTQMQSNSRLPLAQGRCQLYVLTRPQIQIQYAQVGSQGQKFP